MIDKLGTGIKRMKEMMKEHGLEEPEFEEIDKVFRVKLYGPERSILELIPEKEGEDLREKGLNKRQIEALRLRVNRERKIPNKEYRERFDVSKVITYQDLKELVEKGKS